MYKMMYKKLSRITKLDILPPSALYLLLLSVSISHGPAISIRARISLTLRYGEPELSTLTWIRLKLTCQLFPALEGMNLSPYLSFWGEFTGVICFLGIRG